VSASPPSVAARDQSVRPAELVVDSYRTRPRSVVVRRPRGSVVVLGSSQPPSMLDAGRLASGGVSVLRRRSGGSAVHLRDADPLWVELWVPSGDRLFDLDVVRASERVGEWWAAALGDMGASRVQVHRGALVPGDGSEWCCFAGVGPGEVLSGRRKLVGLGQWRCREGALFQCAVHDHWDAGRLAEVLALDPGRRGSLVAAGPPPPTGLDGVDGLDPVAGGGAAHQLVVALRRRLPEPETWRFDEGAEIELER
jgi:lipoate---protein ligase